VENRQIFFRLVALALALISMQILAERVMLRINEKENGKSVYLQPGDTVEIILESNPTTGYQWMVDEWKSAMLKLGDSDFISTPGIGSTGKQVLRFKVIAEGQTQLRLVYRRSFEVGVAPVKSFTLNMVVKDP
jgi:inhibitor of cysteine peptidase